MSDTMVRWLENKSYIIASAFKREAETFWFCPLMIARKGFVDHKTVVMSLLFIWGWDKETPFSFKPRTALGRRLTGLSGELLDVSLTLSWLGFAIVVHSCADLSRSNADEA